MKQINVSLSAEIPGGIESHPLPSTRDGLSCLRYHISNKPSSSSWLISCDRHHEMEANESVNHSWDFRFTIDPGPSSRVSFSLSSNYKKYQKWTKRTLRTSSHSEWWSDGCRRCRHLISHVMESWRLCQATQIFPPSIWAKARWSLTGPLDALTAAGSKQHSIYTLDHWIDKWL